MQHKDNYLYIDQQAKNTKPFTRTWTLDDVDSFVSTVEIMCVHEKVWRDGSRLVPQPTTGAPPHREH